MVLTLRILKWRALWELPKIGEQWARLLLTPGILEIPTTKTSRTGPHSARGACQGQAESVPGETQSVS